MDRSSRVRRPEARRDRRRGNVPGIVIADGSLGVREGMKRPRVRAFIYGEEIPTAPTLPFGRWKEAS